jgi:NAD(P)-dependent dehydrogenase (short-subunit alcohol dehydrogenase family)
MPPFDTTDSAAIVSGHSRGIGEAIAGGLLGRGIRVLGVSRHSNTDLVRRHGGLLQEAAVDFGDASALTRWVESGALGRFVADAKRASLVNNAGVIQPIGPLETQDASEIARAITVNVAAAFMLSAAFVRATSQLAERRILHVSSGAGRKPYAGWSIYCSTKAAMDHHARCVALDRTSNLRIASVAPGVVDTEMQAEIRASTDQNFPDRPRFVQLHRDHALPTPERTGGRLVDYLLSDDFGAEPVFDLRDFIT